MAKKLRYSEFEDRIDLERFYEAIGFEPFTDRRGNDVGHCIWPEKHANGDTTGKFAIHRDNKVYNCYVCGGGSLLSLAMEVNDMGVDDATHWLYQFAKPPADDDKFLEEFERDLEDVEVRTATLPYFNAHVLDSWRKNVDDDVLDYLAEKWGIGVDVATEYNIGFDPDHTRRVKDEVYVGPALIFPVYWKDRLVGWQERWLDPEEDRPQWVPKYTNTTDLPRSEIIFNYDKALHRPISASYTLVVESVPSVYSLLSHGLNAVSTFGSSASDAQKRLLRRFSGGIVLCPDNDVPKKKDATPAGIKWRNSLTEYLERFIPVWHLPPPPGKPGTDVADLLVADPLGFAKWVKDNIKDPIEHGL